LTSTAVSDVLRLPLKIRQPTPSTSRLTDVNVAVAVKVNDHVNVNPYVNVNVNGHRAATRSGSGLRAKRRASELPEQRLELVRRKTLFHRVQVPRIERQLPAGEARGTAHPRAAAGL
jgi:hypothetical protein